MARKKDQKLHADSWACIVGATGALGTEIAQLLAGRGIHLICHGRRKQAVDRLLDTLPGQIRATGITLDFGAASQDEYERLEDLLDDQCPRIDLVVIAAASFRGLSPLAITPPEHLALDLHLNVTAPMMLWRSCLRQLELSAQPTTAVIIDGDAHDAYFGGYGMAQGALQSFVRIAGAEHEGRNHTVAGLRLPRMAGGLRSKTSVDAPTGLSIERAAEAIIEALDGGLSACEIRELCVNEAA